MKLISLSNALILKNQLIEEINKLKSKIINYNCYNEKNTPPYNSLELYSKFIDKSTELITLKTKITEGNKKIQHLIYESEEIKNQIAMLNNLNTTEGIQQNYDDDVEMIFKSSINAIKRDEMVEALSSRLNEIYQELNDHNYKTKIKIEE